MFGQRYFQGLAALLATLCFRDAGSRAATLENLISESLILIPPSRPQLVSSMSSAGQQTARQAKEFTEQQQGTCR